MEREREEEKEIVMLEKDRKRERKMIDWNGRKDVLVLSLQRAQL